MLNVGIVGCGEIFEYHRRAWARLPRVHLAGFVDVDPDVVGRRIAAGDAGVAFDGLDDLISSCNIVDVCTPPDTHVPIVMAAIEQGRHVLIEKPVTLRLREWEEITELAQRRNVKLGALHNQKFFEINQRAKRWSREGRIGRVLRVNDEHMVTPDDDALWQTGHWCHDLPGGRWFETLPHNLYLLHFLAGPHELVAIEARSHGGADPRTRAEEVTILLTGERSLATIHFSASCELHRRTTTIVGTEGVIEVVPPGRVATFSRMTSSTLKKAAGLPFLHAFSKLGQMVPDRVRFLGGRLGPTAHDRNVEQFVRHVIEGAENPTPWDEITYTVRLAEEIGVRLEARLEELRSDQREGAPF